MNTVIPPTDVRQVDFHMKVLGRMVEHLGVQLYKHRDAAIAELIANCWDAGAKRVEVQLPEPTTYDQATSVIEIVDDGGGMDEELVDHAYLVMGRNRRTDPMSGNVTRPIMGRKGIGKLAGFGIAERMVVETWRDGTCVALTLDSRSLNLAPGEVDEVPIPGTVGPVPASLTSRSISGTRLILEVLKHRTVPEAAGLHESLARRFSRSVKGAMTIQINGDPLKEPVIDLESRSPKTGSTTHLLPDGKTVKYWYGLGGKPIPSVQLRGFTVQATGKTAQAPPFYFEVEGKASGQHATKYLTGTIEADFLDEGDGSESDIISTDRQEIDWGSERALPLYKWGQELTREILRSWSHRKQKQTEDLIDKDAGLSARIKNLDKPSQQRLKAFVKTLAESDPDPARTLELADQLVRAFEYRHFVDVITQLDEVADDPEGMTTLLDHLQTWRVMESRAILEIINGRLRIVEKFHALIVNDSSETASHIGGENLHDLIASFPWLLNPEWQVLAEEKTISKQLAEWGDQELNDADERSRYDFLALTDDAVMVVIEIKRAGYAATLEDLQRLERYASKLARAHPNIRKVFVNNGAMNIDEKTLAAWKDRRDTDLLTWSQVHERVKRHYEHYRGVLEGDVKSPGFARKTEELAETRRVLESGAYRGPTQRRRGLGPQDIDASTE
jgi:hypothetical protein